MKPEKDILSEAIEQLKAEPVEPGPPQAVIDATLERLAAIGNGRRPRKTGYIKLFAKVTAAAAVLIMAGYGLGRLSATSRPDIEQLKAELTTSLTASIEPVVRENVIAEMQQQWQVAMNNGFARIQNDLSQQYRAELNRFAIGLLTASNARTNEILDRLVQNIQTAETKKMQWVARALQEIDQTHRQEQSQLAAGLEALACQTEDGLQQTREELVQLLAKTYPAAKPSNTKQKEETPDL